ncbi:MAG: hypothetical protein EOM59_16855 [Clostridia bacterium]|nr:hypothetical protein [Clostridia bacterium]
MKEKIEQIIIEAQLGNIGSWKAAQQVLDLFAVVGQGEQLPTRKEIDEGWEKLRNSGLDKPLDKIE